MLVFQGLLQHTAGKALQEIGEGLFLTILIGGLIGWLAARLLVMMSKNRWLPEFLESLVALMLVLVAFSMAHHFQHESGLFSVTLMGVLIANQDEAELNIIEFKEILGTLLVSLLFIVLAAQVKFSQLLAINAKSVLYVICLLFVVRPLCVWCATLGAGLGWRERLFLSWMAPRGIVAAAIVSLFSTQLQKAGVPGAEEMVPLIFLVILVTVVVYGLTGPLLARAIGVGDANPQGLLLIGAQGWTRALAEVLQQEEVQVKLLDGNYEHVAKARMDGLDVEYTNVLSDQITEEVDLQGIGRLLALTSNEYVNSLVVLHFAPVFPKHELYQLLVRPDEKSTSSAKLPGHSLRGRPLFCEGWSASLISDAFEKGAIFKATSLTEAFPYEDFQAHYKGQAVPLFVLYPDGTLRPLTAEEKPNVEPPCTLVSLVLEEPEEQEEE